MLFLKSANFETLYLSEEKELSAHISGFTLFFYPLSNSRIKKWGKIFRVPPQVDSYRNCLINVLLINLK